MPDILPKPTLQSLRADYARSGAKALQAHANERAESDVLSLCESAARSGQREMVTDLSALAYTFGRTFTTAADHDELVRRLHAHGLSVEIGTSHLRVWGWASDPPEESP